jgi:hypothetical protein
MIKVNINGMDFDVKVLQNAALDLEIDQRQQVLWIRPRLLPVMEAMAKVGKPRELQQAAEDK